MAIFRIIRDLAPLYIYVGYWIIISEFSSLACHRHLIVCPDCFMDVYRRRLRSDDLAGPYSPHQHWHFDDVATHPCLNLDSLKMKTVWRFDGSDRRLTCYQEDHDGIVRCCPGCYCWCDPCHWQRLSGPVMHDGAAGAGTGFRINVDDFKP